MKTAFPPVPVNATSAAGRAMAADGLEIQYHVREADNRVRVVLTQPGWALQQSKDYWYLSVEDLRDGQWQHRSHHPMGMRLAEAMETAKRLYDQEASSAPPRKPRVLKPHAATCPHYAGHLHEDCICEESPTGRLTKHEPVMQWGLREEFVEFKFPPPINEDAIEFAKRHSCTPSTVGIAVGGIAGDQLPAELEDAELGRHLRGVQEQAQKGQWLNAARRVLDVQRLCLERLNAVLKGE